MMPHKQELNSLAANDLLSCSSGNATALLLLLVVVTTLLQHP
jgi:hypothetical protein